MKNRITQRLGSLLGILVVALIGVTFATTSAHALLAAGTSIDNQATVTFDEGTAPPSNTVSTTVRLVSGLTWDDPSLSPATQSYGELTGLTTDYTVDLVNTGNGSTTASVSDGTTQSSAFLGAGTWTINGVASPASVTLGATVSDGPGSWDGTTTSIDVGNLVVADLAAGDTVRINGNDYIVHANTTATQLHLTTDATADVGAAGVPIGEVVTITYTGTTGDLDTANSLSESHNHSLTATDDVGGGLNADGNPSASDTVSSNADGGAGTAWQTFVTAGALSISKYVRNVTTGQVGVTPLAYDGNTYYQSGVTGNSDPDGAGVLVGDTLEYLLVVTNAGPGDASNVVVTDAVNATYLALTTTSVDIDTDGSGAFDVTDAITNNAATFVSPNLTVYAGVGGSTVGPTGGAVAFDGTPTTAIRFQVVIQ